MFALTLETALEAFVLATVTAGAVALVSGFVALIRHSHRVDRNNHALVRWARRAGRQIGIPFPLDDEEEP